MSKEELKDTRHSIVSFPSSTDEYTWFDLDGNPRQDEPMDEKEKAGLTRVYNHLQEMEKKALKKQLQTIEKNNEKNDL